MSPAAPDTTLRASVLISGAGSTLANLIEATRDGRLPRLALVQVVSSRSDVRGVTIAREAGIPLQIVRKRDYASASAFSAALTRTIDRANVQLVLMAGFLCLWLLPEAYRGRVLNIHPALLPKFGGQGMHGRHVHAAVLAAGERESGCSVHLVDQQYDHGPIVAQRRVPVLATDTPETLAARVGIAERELYPAVLREVCERGLPWLAAHCS